VPRVDLGMFTNPVSSRVVSCYCGDDPDICYCGEQIKSNAFDMHIKRCAHEHQLEHQNAKNLNWGFSEEQIRQLLNSEFDPFDDVFHTCASW
jgi:hypothetical protein